MNYLVVWQDDCGVIQSQVQLMQKRNPKSLTNNDWIKLAALSEGYSESDTDSLVERGYDLYLVCGFPEAFYGD